MSGAKDLRFIGREFHKQGEELRNDRSASLSLVETGGNRWKGKTQMIRGTSSAGSFEIYERVKVLWFSYMEEVVCNGDDLILTSLLNFEPLNGLERWRDVRMFGSASNSTCKSILNMLKALNLSDG